MVSRRTAIAAIAGLIGMAAPALAQKKSPRFIRYDTNGDGKVDLDEAKKAASDVFDKLDVNKAGKLSFKELRGRLSHREFAAADTDKDGSLSKAEYLAVVERRFKLADKDHDGFLKSWEFHTRAGHYLSRLLD